MSEADVVSQPGLKKLCVSVLVLGLVAMVFPLGASAATYYVGSPQNATGSCDVANKCSIDRALEVATANGDVVEVDPGTYVHSATRFNSSTMMNENNLAYVQNGVTLRGAPGGPRPTIVQNDLYSLGCNCGMIAALSNARVEHMRLVSHDNQSGSLALIARGSVQVEDSEIFSDGLAFGLESETGGHVANSLIVGGSSAFVTGQLTSTLDFDVEQSTLVGGVGGGAGTGMSIQALNQAATIDVHNSILHSQTGQDLFVTRTSGSATVNLDHSALRNLGTAGVNGGVANDQGGLVTTPVVFAGPGDYRPAAASPIVNAGEGPVSTLDLNGRPFTNGAPDIGAYEYYAPSVSPPDPQTYQPLTTQSTGSSMVTKLNAPKPKIARKRKRGRAQITVACPAAAQGACKGKLTLKQGRASTSASFSGLAPGTSKTVGIKAKKGKATATIAVTDAVGVTGSTSAAKKLS